MQSETLLLVVGLGNPGADYARTRHNAGFMVVEELAKRASAGWQVERKFDARVAKSKFGPRRALLVQPQTFMNASGETVGALVDFYQVPASGVLVVVDDADLPFGQIRMRPKGSSGGHHGLESIEQRLGTREFARVRVGIGRTADGRREITNYVLGRFDKAELKLLEAVLQRAANQVECWATSGAELAMNRFNGVVDSAKLEA